MHGEFVIVRVTCCRFHLGKLMPMLVGVAVLVVVFSGGAAVRI